MSNKTVRPKFEAEYKLRSWGPGQTCPTHYVKISFNTQKEMEAWVDHNYELPIDNEFAKYYTVTDLEQDIVLYRNFTLA